MTDVNEDGLPPILPVGTAVVALVEIKSRKGVPVHPKGMAGIILRSPASPNHRYRVRFPGGDEVALLRQEFHVLRRFQTAGLTRAQDSHAEFDLTRDVIYRCVVGSRAYGLVHDESDTDLRGVYLPPAEMHWSIYGVPEQIENQEAQECYWEIEKFLKLALRANPNVMEVLYSPIVEHATAIAQEMLDMRDRFLSKLVYQTYNGYAMSQFRKLEQDIRTQGSIKWKHAMHLIRLLLAGITILQEGYVPVRVENHRPELMRIRDGLMPFDEVNRWRLELHKRFERAFVDTSLPERPDYEAANALLIRARISAFRK